MGKHPTILIVDDQEQVRDLLQVMCSFYNLHSECVTNGQEAVDALEQKSFTIVFMDLDMPIMGGLEATRSIRQYERQKNRKRTPIIAISGSAMRDSHQILEAGMDGFIQKPIELEDLLNSIKPFIDLKDIES